MINKLLFFFISILLLLLSSCGDNSIYDHNEQVSKPWTADNKAVFSIEVNDTLTAFDFFINIRNTTDYNYSNLYLFIKTDFPDGRFSVDTAELFLADIKGNWLGKGYGEIKDNQILFRRRGRFPMSGIYTFTFEQAMRDKGLEGIESVGIRVVKSESKR